MPTKSLVPNLEELNASQLQELEAELVEMFNSARSQDLTVERVVEVAELANAVEEVRGERGRRAELAAGARQEAATKVAEIAERIGLGAKADPALNKGKHGKTEGDDHDASDDTDN